MDETQLIEALSETTGRRIRKPARPDLFDLLVEVFHRLSFVGLEERGQSTGVEDLHQEALYDTYENGQVWALTLPMMNPDLVPVIGGSFKGLKMCFLGDMKLDPTGARALAELPKLKYLAVGLGDAGEETLRLLSKSTSLEYLLLSDCASPTDLSALGTLPRLKTLLLTDRDYTNHEALAELPALRHLYCDLKGSGAFLRKMTRLESLVVDGSDLDSDFLPSMTALRRLHLDSVIPPLAVLENLPHLTEFSTDSYRGSSLEPFTKLKSLEKLGLTHSNLTDLSGLHHFERLKGFSIENGSVGDISLLCDHASLEFLQLSGNPIEKMPERLEMPALKHLVWDGRRHIEKLANTDVLSGCPNLKILNLSHHALTDVTALAQLGNLRYLDLSGNRLSDLSPLAGLPNVHFLNISGNQIADLAALADWTAIDTLLANGNPIGAPRDLSRLRSLEQLKLHATGLRDLDFTKRLRNLFELDVSKNEIKSMEPLVELPNLARIDVRQNQITEVPSELVERRNLEALYLDDNPLAISAELYREQTGIETLTMLRNYQRSLARGRVRNNQAKLLLVGNGRVGKTSVIARLIDDEFDPDQPSTHGIQLRHWALQDVAPDKLKGQPLMLDVWDFGGQDIYHATHRVFMKSRALYLLIWDRDTESTRYSLDELGERYENFPVSYWIDYIKALSGSPVIIVQNKVDKLSDKNADYGAEMQQIYPPPGGVIDFRYVSAKRDAQNGMAGLRESIELAVESIESIGYELPAQWVEVRDRLLGMDRKYMSFEQFQQLCRDVGMLAGEDMSLIQFLHHSGVVFYQPEDFGDRLILDQQWAIEAVYALLDRRGGAYADLKVAARFGLTLDQLKQKVWRHFSSDEHHLLLEFMKSCEICFEFSEGIFFIPQLLPDDKPSRVSLRWDEPTEYSMQISYPFLHRAIIDRFLVRTGLLGADDEPEIWRNGIIIYDSRSKTEALVEGVPERNLIRVDAKGSEPVEMLQMIRREFDDLHADFPAEVAFSADHGRSFVRQEDLAEHMNAGSSRAPTLDGGMTDIAAFKAFVRDRERSLPKGRLKKDGPLTETKETGEEIFISYAWGDTGEAGESREAIVDRLYETLLERRHNVIRDKKDITYRMLISEFMRRLGKGKAVVVVVSDKYLRSPHCMFELLEIYQQGEFLERIVPIVLPDAKLYDFAKRLEYVAYWKDRKREIENLINRIGIDAFSSEGTFREYDLYYRRVFNNVDKLLSILANLNGLTPQKLEENDFERVVQTIERRLADPAPAPA